MLRKNQNRARFRGNEDKSGFSKNNLEYDLRSTDWICQKVQNSKAYGQNLYAALCNNEFLKLEVIPILKDDFWCCSWRYAGSILSDMVEKGDYMDWYCSGIGPVHINFAAEGTVTDEIRNDLKLLGWIVRPTNEEII